MTALTQDAWYENSIAAAAEISARRVREIVQRRGETRQAAIRFIQSQIGGPFATRPAVRSDTPERVDF